MTNQAAPIKRRGNPNFGRKAEIDTPEQAHVDDLKKQYVFQLIKTHEKAKPKDEFGQLIGSPFQPFYGIVNSGMAWDPDYIPAREEKKPKAEQKKGGVRAWRYVYNHPSIWVDDQVDPTPTKEDLSDAQNDLVFRNGVLRVFGHETNKLLALKLNNAFDGCERPLKSVPKEYVLLDQEKIDKEVLQALDDSFEAEKAAREATVEEMYACAYYFGINLQQSDDAIRKAFISVARSKPKVFNREFVNPKNKYKYTILEGLADNIISASQVPGKVIFVETGAPIFDLKTQDPAEEIATLAVAGVTAAVNLVSKIRKIYEEGN